MSFLSGVLGGVVGFVTGGPAGAVTGAIAGFRGRGGGTRMMMTPAGPVVMPERIFQMPQMFDGDGGGMAMMPMGQRCPPGTSCRGASAGGICIGNCAPLVQGNLMVGDGRGGMCAPRGFHFNKSRYAVCGPMGMAPACIEKNTKLVRNRHLNPANGRAAKRAVRRISATHRLLKRIEKSIRRIKGVPRGRGVKGGRGGKSIELVKVA